MGAATVTTTPIPDTLECLVSQDGDPEEVLVLDRKDFQGDEWGTMVRDAHMNSLFPFSNGKMRLFGGSCMVEAGGCGKNQVIRVTSKSVGPEAVHVGYRCLACGKEHDDVID